MVKGKYEKKKSATAGKYLKKPSKKTTSSKSNFQNNEKAKFKMDKKFRRNIYSVLAASTIAFSGFVTPNPPSIPANADTKQETTPILESTKAKTIYSIGIANDNATIEIAGKSYEIDSNSFVIVSENQALAYDVHGNMLKGSIDSEDYKEVKKLTEEEMSKFNIRQVISDIGVNVRSSGELSSDNLISTVPSYDYVLAYDPITPEPDDKEWLYTLSINNDTLYEGYIREDLIKEVDTFDALNYRVEENMENIENMMYVDTSEANYVSLNLRSEPKLVDSSNIIAEIPYGSLIHILGDKVDSYNKTWVNVSYQTLDGNQFEGWVSDEYLSKEAIPEKVEVQEEDVVLSKYVTGIDISSILPEKLEELLQTGIPNQVSSTFGTFDTSELAGDIDFVYIKLGASPYKTNNFAPLKYDTYIKQVEVCEKLNIPYGFYYYSTAITVEEANMELDCIKERIDYLNENYDLKNNKLEIAVDIELHDATDRQYRGDINEQTKAKAVLINGIQEQGLSNNVLIYGPSRVMKSDLDQIINLNYLHSLLNTPDNVNLWLTSLMNEDGSTRSSLQNDIDYAEEQGFSTPVCQLLLDCTVIGQIDVNRMTREHLESLLTQENIHNEQSNEDYER